MEVVVQNPPLSPTLPPSSNDNAYDVIVVGGGIAGSSMAYSLGKDGRKVLLIERDMKEPDRIVGELLQPGGIEALKSLGLGDCVYDIDATNTFGYCVFYEDKEVVLSYPKQNQEKRFGQSFHHGKFVMKLRQACLNHPNVTVQEATVNQLDKCHITQRIIGVTCVVNTKSEGEKDIKESLKFVAPLTIVADGCFSKFRKDYIDKSVASFSNFVGIVMHDFNLPYPQHGHVILAHPAPILVYQIGTNDCRVLVDIPGKLPSSSNGDLKRYLLDKVSLQIPAQIRKPFVDAVESQRIRSMPNSFLPPTVNKYEGLILLGDAMNMRHPLTGGGMTVALSDVVILRKLLHPSNTPSFQDTYKITQQCKIWHKERKQRSTVINILAQALYRLFSAGNDRYMKILRRSCFDYFKLGGIAVTHPMGLLGGIIPSPILLSIHFFSVAILGTIVIFGTPRMHLVSPKQASFKLIEDASSMSLATQLAFALKSTLLSTILLIDSFLSIPFNLFIAGKVILKACQIFLPLVKSELD